MPSRGFQSSVDYTQVFGLGSINAVDSVVVTWPDGTSQSWLQPAIDKTLMAEMGEERRGAKSKPTAVALFKARSLPGNWTHKEDDHVDFYFERGIHEQLNKEGPALAVADLNKDGIDEIFVGAARDSGRYYIGHLPKDMYKILHAWTILNLKIQLLHFWCGWRWRPRLIRWFRGNHHPPLPAKCRIAFTSMTPTTLLCLRALCQPMAWIPPCACPLILIVTAT